ncbi:FAD-dependent oxidoreductase [Nitratifractor sp.]
MSAPRIAIVGGGVAGVTAARILAERGGEVSLFECKEELVSGPPFCHLHAGGNLYREISDEQCLKLLEQSIDFARAYPYTVDRRPTVLAIPTEDAGSPEALLPRLEMLRDAYARLVAADGANEVLGPPEEYFRPYDFGTLERLAEASGESAEPKSTDDWMRPLARGLATERLQSPLILVQEYGLNLFRLAAGARLSLEAMEGVRLRTGSCVRRVRREGEGWLLGWEREGVSTEEPFDYLVNAAGFRTGIIDEMLGLEERRMVEFKAAYIAHWSRNCSKWPEIIFHGERGTPRGMGQFTPYPANYFQLHGMTKEITLYKEGLVASEPRHAQPRLGSSFCEKIEKGWDPEEVARRTRRAIEHIARFIPAFAEAEVGSIPLFGAQQIPGEDPTLRVAEVSFPLPRYARCEIVKVSSALDMAEAIVGDLREQGLPLSETPVRESPLPEEGAIDGLARKIAKSRGYPEEMAGLCVRE